MPTFLSAIGAMLIFGTFATASAVSLGNVGILELAFWSYLLGFVALSASARWMEIGLRDLWTLLRAGRILRWTLFAAFFSLLYDLTFFYSLSHGARVNVALAVFIWPVLFTLMSVYLFRLYAPSRRLGLDLGYSLIGFLGVGLLFADKLQAAGPGQWRGYGGAIVAAFATALFNIYLVRTLKAAEAVLGQLKASLFGNLATLFFCGSLAGVFLLVRGPVPPPSLRAWIELAYIGVLVMGFGPVLWIYAINRNRALVNLAYLTPLISAVLLSLVFKQEVLTWNSLWGAGLILVANYLAQKQGRTPTS